MLDFLTVHVEVFQSQIIVKSMMVSLFRGSRNQEDAAAAKYGVQKGSSRNQKCHNTLNFGYNDIIIDGLKLNDWLEWKQRYIFSKSLLMTFWCLNTNKLCF